MARFGHSTEARADRNIRRGSLKCNRHYDDMTADGYTGERAMLRFNDDCVVYQRHDQHMLCTAVGSSGSFMLSGSCDFHYPNS